MLMLVIAAVAPALLLMWFVYNKDTHPEPTRLIVKGFFFGGLSAFVSTLISGPLLNMGFYTTEPASVLDAVKISFFGVAIPEECAKLLMLWLLLRNCREFDERYDGIVYATTVGLGFAAFENILYVVGSGADWVDVAFTRALFAVPGHFAFAVAMGYWYSKWHFGGKDSAGAQVKMLLYPILLHGAYDSLCFISELNEALSLVITLALIWFCIRLFKRTRARVLKEAAENEYVGSGDSVRSHGYDVNQDWTDKPDEQ
jgi:Predicted membrane protein